MGFFEPNSVSPAPPNRFGWRTLNAPMALKAQPILFSLVFGN